MPDFHTLNDALENAGASCGPAEAHGMLCGILCAEAQQSETRWLEEAEAAFTEILEYLRVSIQLIYEELAGLRSRAGERPLTH